MRLSTPLLLLAALSFTTACGDKDDGADSGSDGATDGATDGGGTDGGGTDGGGTDGGTDSGGTSDDDADGDGYTVADGDCDDGDAAVHPDATEICNDGVDDDCNGTADDADAGLDTATATSWWIDADGDGWGGNSGYIRCENPGTDTLPYVTAIGDCADDDPAVHPDATEVCNDGVDDDCDGYADDEDEDLDTATAIPLWWDLDEDGFGDPEASLMGCAAGYAQADNDLDCDDTDGGVHPGVTEVCNDGVDDDCNGVADDDDAGVDPSTLAGWWLDADGDGQGAGETLMACAAPEHYVDYADDCDDGDPTVHWGATEVCNGGKDDDCDGDADDADEDLDTSTESDWYTDDDGDGYGVDWAASACAGPTGTADQDGDCDDGDDSVYPGAVERCDGEDQDCDGEENASGAAGFSHAGGGWTDLSSDVDGTTSSPESWTSGDDGTLHFCDGTFYTTLELAHDVEVVGHGEVTLNARGSGSVVTVDGSALAVGLTDLTLTEGNGSSALLSVSGGAGGGLACDDGDSIITVTRVQFEDNTASYGGAVAIGECTALIEDSVLSGNSGYNGGAVYQRGGLVRLVDSTVEDNTATNLGGGGAVVRDAAVAGTPLIEISDSYFLDNSAGAAGALYLGDRTEGICEGSGDGAGFWGNTTTGSGTGAVETYGDTHFQAEHCDFGVSGTDEDNGDVDVEAAGSVYSYDDDASFHCHESTCM
ncbi:MAG: putative metal-binding motif-containing protein [Alphaproteobacteria bacterium]|nr:putative metal-binding motif-containing protein [Alphaproteobacteria bacterium]